MLRLHRALAVVAALLGGSSSGCETVTPATCDPSAGNNPEITYTGGTATQCLYTTSPQSGPLLPFQGGTHYALVHGLPCIPQVQAQISFDSSGTADGGSLGWPAGNEALILGVDDREIRIANSTCVDFWLLVTATCPCH